MSGDEDQVDAARPAPGGTRRRAGVWQARCTATSDDEQAVSIVRLGPCRPSR